MPNTQNIKQWDNAELLGKANSIIGGRGVTPYNTFAPYVVTTLINVAGYNQFTLDISIGGAGNMVCSVPDGVPNYNPVSSPTAFTSQDANGVWIFQENNNVSNNFPARNIYNLGYSITNNSRYVDYAARRNLFNDLYASNFDSPDFTYTGSFKTLAGVDLNKFNVYNSVFSFGKYTNIYSGLQENSNMSGGLLFKKIRIILFMNNGTYTEVLGPVNESGVYINITLTGARV